MQVGLAHSTHTCTRLFTINLNNYLACEVLDLRSLEDGLDVGGDLRQKQDGEVRTEQPRRVARERDVWASMALEIPYMPSK